MKPRLVLLAATLTAASLAACDGDTSEPPPTEPDASSDASTMDAGAEDASQDTGTSLPATCEGACREHALSVDFGAQTGSIERAVYGLSAPATSTSGAWEIYIEAIHGGFSGCPAEDSPTPDWTLILSGLPFALDTTALTKADDGLSATFLDYDGRFLAAEPIARAAAVSAAPIAARLDTAPTQQGANHDDGLIALDLDASFAQGAISGRLVATHCASLDSPAAR